MSNHSPTTPPPGLVQQWAAEARSETFATQHLCNQAARWGYQQKIRSGPEWPLVERVADAIAAEATSAGIVNDRPARAAILQVAAWMHGQPCGKGWAVRLEKEAAQSPNNHYSP